VEDLGGSVFESEWGEGREEVYWEEYSGEGVVGVVRLGEDVDLEGGDWKLCKFRTGEWDT
jgi:hypothetical protein